MLKHGVLDSSQYKNKLNNYCTKRFTCIKTPVCIKCNRNKYYYKDKRCATCSKCNINCKDFIKETCIRNTSTHMFVIGAINKKIVT